ncbi:hemophore-related protein [Mycolicibacterium sp. GF69]|uniref:heme-binding protein n=1 Tax=Mycolicibacterium sp. GF69 TaxID=2267251 RepID=UPI000DCEEEFA|nr:heme-binding protein [Mycolicibacterium sp. GF69]RAV10342.1 hemophore-related protein [Mycolicibacterium sp. GF69]
MNRSKRSGLAGAAALIVVGAFGAFPTTLPVANAAPCTASGLATTASGVLGQAGGYLEAHPGANEVLTAAATQPPEDARAAVRAYFTAHPNEYLDLRGIAAPLTEMRAQCGIAVSPGQLATLFDAMGQ